MENLALESKEFKVKNDGMHLIVERPFSLDNLKEFIAQTCLAERCDFLQRSEDIEEICKTFIALLKNNDLNLDEITNIFIAACICYYVNATPENLEWRSQFLQKSYQYVDTLSPMHIHMATKRIWDTFQMDSIDIVFNILTLSHLISLASETGRAIAICLVWTILSQITETETEMCCFHEFSDLMKMLNELDDEMLQTEANISIVYILVQCIGFLINSVVFGKNDDLKKAGYQNYFSYTKRELEKLRKFSEKLTGLVKVNNRLGDNNFELKMTVTEYINVNILSILEEKISEMQTK